LRVSDMANGSVLSQSSTILRDGDRNDSGAGAIMDYLKKRQRNKQALARVAFMEQIYSSV
jgi:hypothetical protein